MPAWLVIILIVFGVMVVSTWLIIMAVWVFILRGWRRMERHVEQNRW